MSRRDVRVQLAARRDLQNLARWLQREVNPATADRVVAAARRRFDMLAESPGLGAPAEAKARALSHARRPHVDRYPNYLISYEPAPRGGVNILRVIHSAQDWKAP